jgi:3-oxoadipate enol-lactonase
MNQPGEVRQVIETSVGRLATRTAGMGPHTLVLWNAIFTDSRIHTGLVRRLDGLARLVLVDGPGHGESTGRAGVLPMAAYAGALAEVIDALDLNRTVAGGTSWGGMVGAELALIQPQRLAGLVMLNTPLFIDGARPGPGARMIAFGARHMLKAAAFRNGVARSFFTAEALRRDPEFAQGFHDMLRKADPVALSSVVRSVLLNGRPLAERLGEISVPTLVIIGRDDPLYPAADHQRAAVRLRDGQVVTVPGKHVSAIDAPDDAARALAQFLASLPAEATTAGQGQSGASASISGLLGQ